VSGYVVTFAPTVAISVNVVPSLERCILNPVSLFELSVQDRLIWLDDAAAAVRFVGAAGVGIGVEVGVGVAVGVGVGVGVPVGVGVGVGVGGGVVLLIWTIFATEGTPFEFRMNSM
jgi:hypothetical protein